jgi:hypothetical protein
VNEVSEQKGPSWRGRQGTVGSEAGCLQGRRIGMQERWAWERRVTYTSRAGMKDRGRETT